MIDRRFVCSICVFSTVFCGGCGTSSSPSSTPPVETSSKYDATSGLARFRNGTILHEIDPQKGWAPKFGLPQYPRSQMLEMYVNDQGPEAGSGMAMADSNDLPRDVASFYVSWFQRNGWTRTPSLEEGSGIDPPVAASHLILRTKGDMRAELYIGVYRASATSYFGRKNPVKRKTAIWCTVFKQATADGASDVSDQTRPWPSGN